MRIPNTKCVICGKLLYRRPFEFMSGREFCCRGCRSELYKRRIPSPNLELGREKGTNQLNGIPKSEAMKRKVSEKNKLFWQTHPEELKERGLKIRKEEKDKITPLYLAIRTSAENIKWINKITKRDNGICQICGSVENIEVHHKKEFADLVKIFNIKTLDDARNCEAFWDINNGFVVCRRCHYKIHNKKYYED